MPKPPLLPHSILKTQLEEAEAAALPGNPGLNISFEFVLSLHDLVLDVTASSPGQALDLCLFCKMSLGCLNLPE